jgi:hypothetical protein
MLCMDEFVVKDLRGTGDGWHVTVQATQWKCTATVSKGCTVGTSTIPQGSLFMDVPVITCDPSESCAGPSQLPTLKMTGALAIDVASPVTVASAPVNTGLGTYKFTPRTDVCGPNQQCYSPSGALLSSPNNWGQLGLYPVTSGTSATKNGTYSSTLTETIATGPS